MRSFIRTGLFAALFLIGACSSEPSDGPRCEGGACDVDDVLSPKPLAVCKADGDFKTTDGTLGCTPCGEVLADRSGRGFLPAFVGNDALVKKVYMTFEDKNDNQRIDPAEIDCPLAMPAIMAKLAKVDRNGSPPCDKIETRVVSETAALLRKSNASYRAVTSRFCKDGPEFGLLFSSFGFSGNPQAKGTGVHITETGHPGEVEIIAFDQSEGIFNFYKEVGGTMHFFGSSLDFVVAGPGGPGLTSTRGCANCHPGGGLNMKELVSPWTHWAGLDDIDGADTLVKSRADYMGELDTGENLQFEVIQPGNSAWDETKARFLSTATTTTLNAARSSLRDDILSPAQQADLKRRQLKKGLTATQAMLEPLFCTVQVNMEAGGRFGVPSLLLAAERNLTNFPGFRNTPGKVFLDGIALINSRVPGIPGKAELTTEFMMFERSHEDEKYVEALIELGVIDQGFVRDVMMVDFTRPVFSDDRCDLLALVPDLAPADRKLTKIRDALIGALEKAKVVPSDGTPAGQLLAHLAASKAGKPFLHDATLDQLNNACRTRDDVAIIRDALKLRSLQRKLAFPFDGALDAASGTGFHPFAVFEFEASVPADDVAVTPGAALTSATEVHPDARFSPVSCKLITKFEGAGSTTLPDPDTTCFGRIDDEACDFRIDASCQCDTECTTRADCCSDVEKLCRAVPD